MKHIKKKCGCVLYYYTLEDLVIKKQHPKNSTWCDKHRAEMRARRQ